MAASTRTTRSSGAASLPPPPPVPVYCICRQPDDPERNMLGCDGGCDDWFHWDCMGIDQTTYEDILDFICPACEERTGLKTTRETLYISPPASTSPPATFPATSSSLPEDAVADNHDAIVTTAQAVVGASDQQPAPVEPTAAKGKGKAPTSASASTINTNGSKKRKSISDSDAGDFKPRRASVSSPLKKQHRSLSITPQAAATAAAAEEKARAAELKARKTSREGMAGVLRDLLGDQAEGYAEELEELVWKAEDGSVMSGVRKKYLDRIRSLRFNVSKADRTQLRSGISDGSITPLVLSRMSSHDLANSELQAENVQASTEALEYRLLPSTSSEAPRMVHSHKGIVELEDVRAEALRTEEEERRRLASEASKRKRTMADEGEKTDQLGEKVEDEEDVVGTETLTKRRRESGGLEILISPPKLSMSLPKEAAEEQPSVSSSSPSSQLRHVSSPPRRFSLDSLWANGTPRPSLDDGEAITSAPLGELRETSPFQEDEEERRPTSPFRELSPFEDPLATTAEVGEPPDLTTNGIDAASSSAVPAAAANSAPNGSVASTNKNADDLEVRLETLPVVWAGQIINPDHPPATMKAYQVGGRPVDPSLWASIFPSENTHTIVGRVPVDSSRKFLQKTQLSPTKEMLVVLFTGSDEAGLAAEANLREFLVSRSRDALFHPHGSNPVPSDGGKDAYLLVVRPSEPLPSFLSTMDHVQLPRKRSRELLLGVFIRQRSRAAPLAAPPLPADDRPSSIVVPPPPSSAPAVPIPSAPSLAIATSTPTPTPTPPKIDSQSIASLLANLQDLPILANTAPLASASASSSSSFSPNPHVAYPPQHYAPPPTGGGYSPYGGAASAPWVDRDPRSVMASSRSPYGGAAGSGGGWDSSSRSPYAAPPVANGYPSYDAAPPMPPPGSTYGAPADGGGGGYGPEYRRDPPSRGSGQGGPNGRGGRAGDAPWETGKTIDSGWGRRGRGR